MILALSLRASTKNQPPDRLNPHSLKWSTEHEEGNNMSLIQRILLSAYRALDQAEVFKRLLFVWALSFALKWIGIVLGGIQAGSMFVRWQPLPNFRMVVIGLFIWLNYLWIKRFFKWIMPLFSGTRGRLRALSCVGAIYLVWNRFRFGVVQDGVEAACDAASGYMISAALSELHCNPCSLSSLRWLRAVKRSPGSWSKSSRSNRLVLWERGNTWPARWYDRELKMMPNDRCKRGIATAPPPFPQSSAQRLFYKPTQLVTVA